MVKGIRNCQFFRDVVRDDGVLRTEVASADRVFSHAAVSNYDEENPVIVTLAHNEIGKGKPRPVHSVEVEPDGEFYFNPEDFEFDIAAGEHVELHASAPGGGEVGLSILTYK